MMSSALLLALTILLSLESNAFSPKKGWHKLSREMKLTAKNEISPGVFEFRSNKPGELPPELAKLMSPEFIKQNNLNFDRSDNRNNAKRRPDEGEERNSFRPRTITNNSPKRDSLTTKFNGKRVPNSIRRNANEENENDNISVEDLERQLAYETGIGSSHYDDDDSEMGEKVAKRGEGGKRGKFETMSDQIMKDKSRFQGFASSQKSPTNNQRTIKYENDDEDDDYDDDDESYVDSPNRIHNPLIMKEQPLKKSPPRPQTQKSPSQTQTKKLPSRPLVQPKKSENSFGFAKSNNYNDNIFDDDEIEDYEEEEEEEVSPPIKKLEQKNNNPIKLKPQKKNNNNNNNDDDEDYDAIVKSLQEKYKNKYLFDLENDDKSIVNLKTIDKSDSTSSSFSNIVKNTRSTTSTTHVTPSNKDDIKASFQPLPKSQYNKQILNDEFYRMKKPNITYLELKKQKKI